MTECRALNPEGTFVFLKRETSLMRNVDEICNELASKEEVINLLVLTIGTLQYGFKTEGWHYPATLNIYARSRFTVGPEDTTAGVPLVEGLALARGTDGQIGSCVYSIDANGESANLKVERFLAQLRRQGMVELVSQSIESEIKGTLATGKGGQPIDDPRS